MNKLLLPQIMNIKSQSGFTLIELMISATLGIIVIGGMYSLFSVNKESIRVQQNVAVAQEKVNFALEFITEDVRRAGYPGYGDQTLSVLPFGSMDAPTFNAGDRFDTLTIRFMGRSQLSPRAVPPIQPGDFIAARDCLGNDIPDGEVVEVSYFVRPTLASGIVVQELVCQVVGAGTEAIIDQVEGFKVLYGIDTTVGPCVNIIPGTAARDAGAECMAPDIYVDGDGLQAALQGRVVLEAVKTIKIGLVVSSEEVDIVERSAGLQNSQFQLLGTFFQDGLNQSDFSNGRIRRYGIKTIALRQTQRGP